jgi:hypothetical protein
MFCIQGHRLWQRMGARVWIACRWGQSLKAYHKRRRGEGPGMMRKQTDATQPGWPRGSRMTRQLDRAQMRCACAVPRRSDVVSSRGEAGSASPQAHSTLHSHYATGLVWFRVSQLEAAQAMTSLCASSGLVVLGRGLGFCFWLLQVCTTIATASPASLHRSGIKEFGRALP